MPGGDGVPGKQGSGVAERWPQRCPGERHKKELGLSPLSIPHFNRCHGWSRRCQTNQPTLEEAPGKKDPIRDESAPESCHSPRDSLSVLACHEDNAFVHGFQPCTHAVCSCFQLTPATMSANRSPSAAKVLSARTAQSLLWCLGKKK